MTEKQRDLLLYIATYKRRNEGLIPTLREMAASQGLSSISGVHRLLAALEERGFIRRLPNRARAIEILKMPGGM